jgi:hypothetical protein
LPSETRRAPKRASQRTEEGFPEDPPSVNRSGGVLNKVLSRAKKSTVDLQGDIIVTYVMAAGYEP